jgi:hypothetical protein
MTTAYTSLLGLALPVQGELSGVWGDVVNNSITSLLDTSVAGTTNVSTDTDVTLTTTTGAANTARQAILLFSGARTALRTVTAPAQSKIYTVINATTGGFSVKLVGAGPTTGVTIVAGESAVCAWNGSDFVKVSNTGGSASFTNVTVTGTTTLSGLTASTALALDASKNVVSVTNTGTGNNVLSASPTLTGTIGAASLTLSTDLTLSGGTANGVAYLNGSKVVTSGSALTFDGTNLGVGAGSALTNITINGNSSGGFIRGQRAGANQWFVGDTASALGSGTGLINFVYGNDPFIWYNGGTSAEQMRLTSTGLGIGTSSPATKLDVVGSAQIGASTAKTKFYSDADYNGIFNGASLGSNESIYMGVGAQFFYASGSEQMRLNSTGLGVGTSSPAAKLDVSGGSIRVNEDGVGTKILTLRSDYAGLGPAINVTTTDPLLFLTANTERARIDSSGNMGIGTSSPFNPGTTSQKSLEISGSTYATLYLSASSATVRGQFSADNANSFVEIGSRTNHPLVFLTNNTERARITSNGNLLVGTTTSSSKLTLDGTQTFRDGADSRVGTIKMASGAFQIATNSSFELTFQTNATERARIDASGNLLVGRTAQTANELFNATTTTSTVWSMALNSVDRGWLNRQSSSSGGLAAYFEVGSSNTLVGSISTSSSATTYSTSSDYRLKNTIAPMTGALAKVALLKPVTYKWNVDGSNGEGFIAHELAEVCPQAVVGEKDAIDAEGKPQYQGIDTSFLVATLTAAIQELKAEFDAYKASHP